VIPLGFVTFIVGAGFAYGTAHGALGANADLTARVARLSPWGTVTAVVGLAASAVFFPAWPSRLACLAGALMLSAGLRGALRSWRRALLMFLGYTAGITGMILYWGPEWAASSSVQ